MIALRCQYKLTGMRYAWVTTNLLDLRAQPRFNAERVSQVLFGEIVTLGARKNGYCRILIGGGYRGWADGRFLSALSDTRRAGYVRRINRILAVKTARIFDSVGKNIAPHFLFYGTRLSVRSRRGRQARVVLPDGTARFLKAGSLCPINEAGTRSVTGAMLVSEARKFLGVPYLWGGISPAGFDCSGFVQTVCARFGLTLPRDTREQVTVGSRRPRKETRSGDLLFFKRHVGFAIGRHRVIHASAGGTGVRINSLRAGDRDYREDLDRDFDQTRRIV